MVVHSAVIGGSLGLLASLGDWYHCLTYKALGWTDTHRHPHMPGGHGTCAQVPQSYSGGFPPVADVVSHLQGWVDYARAALGHPAPSPYPADPQPHHPHLSS